MSIVLLHPNVLHPHVECFAQLDLIVTQRVDVQCADVEILVMASNVPEGKLVKQST
jgi:hypothetical protein